MRTIHLLALLGACLGTLGCQPSLGRCSDDDRARAHTIVYDTTGTPMYAGQAIMVGSCAGGGTACHSDTALTRYGTPYDLNFDPLLGDDLSYGGDERAGAAHLYAAQVRISRNRDDIFRAISDESMPPGELGEQMVLPYFQYASPEDTVGAQMPSIATAEGLELVRTWLACGVPVIEATTNLPSRPCSRNEDCSPLPICDFASRECVDVGHVAAPHPQ